MTENLSSRQTTKYRICLDAEREGCPYGGGSRENCTKCQDLPIWYFDGLDIEEFGSSNDTVKEVKE